MIEYIPHKHRSVKEIASHVRYLCTTKINQLFRHRQLKYPIDVQSPFIQLLLRRCSWRTQAQPRSPTQPQRCLCCRLRP